MTYDVILPGKTPRFRGRCDCCNTLFDCDARDGKVEVSYGHVQGVRMVRERWLKVSCPNCSFEVRAKPIEEV